MNRTAKLALLLPLTFISLLFARELSLDDPPVGFGDEMGLAPLVDKENVTPTHPEPGFTKKIQAFHHPDTAYDLYLPSAYTKNPDRRFPLLLVQNPGGRPNIRPYREWADGQEVILLGLHKVDNGMKQHFKPRHWRAFIKDLEAKEVRFQKGLLMTVGMSGGSADGERFTRHFPDYTCGVIIMGVTLVPHGDRRDHIAAGLIIGGKDVFQGPSGREKLWRKIRESDIAYRTIYDIGRKHRTAPMSETLMLLDWILDLGRLRSPELSEDAKEKHLVQLRKEMRTAATLPSGAARKNRIAYLLTLPPLKALPEAEPLRTLWVEDALTLAAESESPADRFVFLLDISTDKEVFPQLSEAERAPLDKVLTQLERQMPGLTGDWRELETIIDREWEAHLDKEALRGVNKAYQAFLNETSFAPLEKRALEARKRIAEFL